MWLYIFAAGAGLPLDIGASEEEFSNTGCDGGGGIIDVVQLRCKPLLCAS
jgi:hypothetical protein